MNLNHFKDKNEKVNSLRKDFPILNKTIHNKKLIYFDNASTSQKPQIVISSVAKYYANYNANVNRSGHELTIQSSLKVEETRKIVKRFINAESCKNIIFNSGTTDGTNTVTNSLLLSKLLKENDEIIVTTLEHNSNLLPWINIAKFLNLKIKLAKFNEMGIIQPEQIKSLITDKTKIIAISGISNILGTTQDLEAIGKIAKDNKIILSVDAAQMAPHMNIDVNKINCDFLVFSGHKMLAPTGIGVLYISDKIIDKLNSPKLGGNAIEDIFIKNGELNFKPLESPNKFESGTPNIAGIIGLGKAIEYINNISMEFIKEHDKELIEYCVERLQEIDEVEFVLNKDIKRKSIISFTIKNIHSHDIETYLDTMGIAIRSGKTCAYIAFLSENIKKDHLLRISFYLYNTKEEIDTFISCLKRTIKSFY
ncbi:cysteine desulfurase [Borrelia miyamotoi]|uniref:Probable cysteine desulfurase n=1 Tax=Borrelia miyamotoi TaxID=47466 RepID=A0AAQ2WYQ4_9SPIR|nr:aminotransferase class V-fold PLP-dependent enzyme [Borrelia miyamotoi]AGT27087.1 cysteine desulfurase [Borrelia miyamotoi LB-2001]AJA58293.1 cysteine desulfurase [Borrelia miyamotoi]AOW95370.1 cysteine desulfurase [Borrelia miyamotoi]QTL83249.1 cysteine desulfurase [Borrelia miyamotoi]WAZ85466.1 cysteine desulfurase [Borrelia miyamotoi]